MLSQIVNNIGIGLVEATFLNLTTTVATGQATPFTQTMIDNYQRAASLFGNNYIGHGTTTYEMFCAVQAVSEDLTDKSVPEKLVGQVYGFAEMRGTTGDVAPVVSPIDVAMQRAGFVVVEATPTAQNSLSRGTITEVFDTDRCVVLF